MEFAELAREQLPRLYGLARQLVGEDAEDLVQECLLKAYRSHAELRDRQAAPAWLTRILVNCARDRFRSRGRRVREAPLPDVEDFSLYRMIACEDPFPYSDSLHLDFLAPVRPRGRVGPSAAACPSSTGSPLVLVHMHGCGTKHATTAARGSARHAARAAAPRAQAVRERPMGLRRRHGLLREAVRGHDPLRGRLQRTCGATCRDEVDAESRARIAEHLGLPPLLRRDRVPQELRRSSPLRTGAARGRRRPDGGVPGDTLEGGDR